MFSEDFSNNNIIKMDSKSRMINLTENNSIEILSPKIFHNVIVEELEENKKDKIYDGNSRNSNLNKSGSFHKLKSERKIRTSILSPSFSTIDKDKNNDFEVIKISNDTNSNTGVNNYGMKKMKSESINQNYAEYGINYSPVKSVCPVGEGNNNYNESPYYISWNDEYVPYVQTLKNNSPSKI